MLEAIVIIGLLVLLFILFRPQRDRYVRRITKSYNGQRYGKERELY